MSKLAIGYQRVSTAAQATEGVSLEAQKQEVAAYCRLHRLELVAHHEDAGISGKRDLDDRPGLAAAIADCQARDAVLVVYSLSRLARSQRVLWGIIDPHGGLGVRIASVTEPFETITPMGRAMLGMLAVWSALEADMIAERTKAALAELKRQGRRLGGPTMIERREDGGIVFDLERIKLVRFVQSQCHKGLSQRDLVGYLNGMGLKSPKRKKWHLRPLQKALAMELPNIQGVPEVVTLADIHPDYYPANGDHAEETKEAA